MFLTELLKYMYKDVLQQKFQSPRNGKKIDDIWTKIHGIMRCNVFSGPVDQLRDQQYPRRATMRKVDKNAMRSGAGNPAEEKLTEVDEMLMAYIGKESPVLKAFIVQNHLAGNLPRRRSGEDEELLNSFIDFLQEKPKASSSEDQPPKDHQPPTASVRKKNLEKRNTQIDLESKKLRHEIRLLAADCSARGLASGGASEQI